MDKREKKMYVSGLCVRELWLLAAVCLGVCGCVGVCVSLDSCGAFSRLSVSGKFSSTPLQPE